MEILKHTLTGLGSAFIAFLVVYFTSLSLMGDIREDIGILKEGQTKLLTKVEFLEKHQELKDLIKKK